MTCIPHASADRLLPVGIHLIPSIWLLCKFGLQLLLSASPDCSQRDIPVEPFVKAAKQKSSIDMLGQDTIMTCAASATLAGLQPNKTRFQATALGGVTIMTREQLLRVDGYSPLLWDSGLEDDNMQKRLQKKRMWPPDQPPVRRSQSLEEADGLSPTHSLHSKQNVDLQSALQTHSILQAAM